MRLALGIVAIALALCAGTALAEDTKAAARAAYGRGEKLAESGKLREAALAFAEADQLAPTDVALDSAIGAAARTDDPVLVMTLVDRADLTRRSGLPAVSDARGKFAGRVGRVDIPCLKLKPACVAKLDGKVIIERVTVVLPGSHAVSLELGARKRDEDVTVGAEEQRAVELPEEKLAPPPPVVEPDPPSGISPWWLTIGGALTLGFGGGALGTGLASISTEQELSDLQAAGGSVTEQQALIDQGETYSLLSNVFIGASAAAATATLFVGIFAVDWSTPSASPPKTMLVPLPGGALLLVEAAF